MTDIRTLKDVLVNGPIEGETLYNSAFYYGRHDICLLIAETKRKTAEFEKNVKKFEETGSSLYRDKATGRYYHIILWDEIIRRLREEDDVPLDAYKLKEIIIDELDLPKPYKYNCYACTTTCEACPIAERAGQCSDGNSAYYKFSTAMNNGDREAAIKYAEVIVDTWTR